MVEGSRLDLRIIAQPYTVDKQEFIDVMFPSGTTAQLADATARINVKDKFIGKKAWDTTLNEPVYASGPLAADRWDLVSEAFSGPPSATTAELEDIGDAINTDNKRAGKVVWNSTTSLLVVAQGATAGDTWFAVNDNLLDHTPV